MEAQLLGSQQTAHLQPIPQAQPQPQIPPQISVGPTVPQHVAQQHFIDDNTGYTGASQYQQGPIPRRQFSPQGKFAPPPAAVPHQQSSPQHSPVRQTHRPTSLTGTFPPSNFQEIMAAENQRLLDEEAKRRKRNQKIAEMVFLVVANIC